LARTGDPDWRANDNAIGSATIVADSLISNTDPNDPIRVDEAAGFYAVA
jgi:hypothetical protein